MPPWMSLPKKPSMAPNPFWPRKFSAALLEIEFTQRSMTTGLGRL